MNWYLPRCGLVLPQFTPTGSVHLSQMVGVSHETMQFCQTRGGGDEASNCSVREWLFGANDLQVVPLYVFVESHMLYSLVLL